jgi:protoporphyrinogen oxidase
MTPFRIAIIGGGPGGLMTAYRLQRRAAHPREITLFEAGPRLGGKIVTRQFAKAPIRYEAGAAELYDYSQLGPDPLRELVTELGLTTRPMEGGTIVLDDHILDEDDDIARAFGEPTRKALDRFNRRARSLISPNEYYESDWREDNKDPLARQTFREFLSTLSDPIARRYVEIAVHSDLATEPHRTNAMYGLQNYLMDELDYMRLYTIDGGIERITEELTRRITSEVRLRHAVTRVERTPAGRYRVHWRHQGETASQEFDAVVTALPNNWIRAIEWSGDTLSRAMNAHHAFYDYPAHYLRISVLFERPFWRSQITGSYFMLDAFGGCCVYDESSRLDGCEFGVLGWLLGGEAAATMSNVSDAELLEHVLDSLPSSLKAGRELVMESHVQRWVGAVNGLPGGFPMRSPESRHTPEPIEHPRLYLVGDYLFDSTLNGVLDSADTVVDELLEDMELRLKPQVAPAVGEMFTSATPEAV